MRNIKILHVSGFINIFMRVSGSASAHFITRPTFLKSPFAALPSGKCATEKHVPNRCPLLEFISRSAYFLSLIYQDIYMRRLVVELFDVTGRSERRIPRQRQQNYKVDEQELSTDPVNNFQTSIPLKP